MQKKHVLKYAMYLAILGILGGLTSQVNAFWHKWGKVIVANRGSGSISVIQVRNNRVRTIALPQRAGDQKPEPMYVFSSLCARSIFVGDRANNRVVAFDSFSFRVKRIGRTGAGVFHMWGDRRCRQLWVNNDIDNTTTVLDMRTLRTIATVPTPSDLVAQGGKPHDVFVEPGGRFAYITVLGLPGPHDYVVKFSTNNFLEVGRIAVGKDPHLFYRPARKRLYVPCQGTNEVIVVRTRDMTRITSIPVPGAHGLYMTRNQRYLYVTNISGGGTKGLFTIDLKTNKLVGSGVDTPVATPHNIALTPVTYRLYVSHSGATANKVTVYRISHRHPQPRFQKQLTVGINPFGIAFSY